ncbi:MAG: ion transporter [Acidobacteriota bacterium]
MNRLAFALVHERTVVVAILVNALALFMLGFESERDTTASLWFWVDYACVVFFLLEAVLKIRQASWRGYLASGWNRFDGLVVLASLPVLLTPLVDLHGFAVVLLLRLGRLFRLFRLLTFIPNRDHLMAGIRRALRASVGVFLALALVNFILATGASFLFGELAPEHFGNPLMSLYSLFKVFTVEGWYEIPDLLAERASHPGWAAAARGYFVVAVLIGGILGLSLANAVFVDEMTIDNTRTLEAQVAELAAEIRALRAATLARGGPAEAAADEHQRPP